jgi:AcrR family transcriptional regulator
VSAVKEPLGTGRMFRRRQRTRVSLLRAAYEIMSEQGVDGAKIKDITDRADVGFGTFYNYFESKDEIAAHVLDCVINDIGRRNVEATNPLRQSDQALVMPTSIRLWLHEAMRTAMWEWWARRPDLLIDRMRRGFGPFGTRDMRDAVAVGAFNISENDVDSLWGLAVWMMVGGMHDIVIQGAPAETEILCVESIMRAMGVEPARAREISSAPLPVFPPADINWSFELDKRIEIDSAA